MAKIGTIGVLTSGGDAPGMNAAVRAVVRTALNHGINVKGVYKGYNGLLYNNIEDMNIRSVSNILGMGGTSLFSARCPEFKELENVKKAVKNCENHGIEGLVVIGGDGSFRGARDLSEQGLPCIGIPGTIDNDIPSSDFSIGFDTAVNTVVENVDRLRDTTQSHDRCSVVEVMGRHCGDIALYSGICTGAVSVLIPEIKYDIEKDVIKPMQKSLSSGRSHFIVIVAEGVTEKQFSDDENISAALLAKYIQDKTGVESRATILGHIQRGGSPSARDRVLAANLGNYAVELLMGGIGNRIVAEKSGELVNYDIFKALLMTKSVRYDLVKVAREIST